MLYNLTLPRGKIGTRPATTEVRLALATRVEPERDETGAPVGVVALDTYMRGRKAMLAIGDATGAVRLLFRNGTQRANIQAGDAAIGAMERGGANNAWLAVAVVGHGLVHLPCDPNTSPSSNCSCFPSAR